MSLRTAPARRWLVRVLTVLAALACVVLLTVSASTWRLDVWLYDLLIANARHSADDRIVLIVIDDKSQAALGPLPWPRRIHAELLDRLAQAGTRGVATNLMFSGPDRSDLPGDAALTQAVNEHGRVALPVLVERSPADSALIEVLPMPALIDAAAALGHVEVDVDRDGVARHASLYAGLGSAHWPALALALYNLDPDARARNTLPGLRAADGTPVSPHVWSRDYRVMIPYVSPERGFRRISYVDALRGQAAPALLQSRWVLIGTTAATPGNHLLTPLSRQGTRVTGLEYQANLLNLLVRNNAVVALTLPQQLLLSMLLVLLPALWLPRITLRRAWGWAIAGAALTLLVCIGLLYFGRLWFAPMPVLLTLLLGHVVWSLLRLPAPERLAHSDTVTGLASRRMFDITLERELAAARRANRPLSLLLIDLDHFKHFNDNYGQQAGNDALRQIARVLAASARRPRDLVARYGGDELAVILPETAGHAAIVVSDTILQGVRDLEIRHAESAPAPTISTSIGVATFYPVLEGHEVDLLKRADAALYRAKQEGRDRISSASVSSPT